MINKEYKFVKISEKGKSKSELTFIFEVNEKGYGSALGTIKWHPSWRHYAFYPNLDTFYEKECLRNIAEFLEELKIEKAKLKDYPLQNKSKEVKGKLKEVKDE